MSKLQRIKNYLSFIFEHNPIDTLKYTFVRHFYNPSSIRFNNIIIPYPKDHIRYFVRGYEKNIHKFIEELYNIINFKTFVSAGAYPGDYIFQACRLKIPYIIGFEPNPQNYIYTLQVLDLNKKRCMNSKVKIYNLALGETKAVIKMIIEPNRAYGTSHIHDTGFDVKMIELNRISIYPPCLIQLDVEGYEINVLRGASKYWSKCFFITEIWTKNRMIYLKWFRAHNFKYYFIDDENVFLIHDHILKI